MASSRRKRTGAAQAAEGESIFGPIAAGVVALALILPFALWGNPYPAALFPYWLVGTLAVALIGIVLFKLHDRVMRLAAAVEQLPAPAFVIAVAVVTTMLSAAFAIYSFHRFASTSDEIAQLWHARILLSGRWSLPVDPNREFFSLDTVVDSGRWYSQFPIGGPLVLALGVVLNAPWLINPLLAGGSVAGVYLFTRRAYGDGAARWASALYTFAPMILMMAGTCINHVPAIIIIIG